MSSSKKPILAVDVDEVLLPLHEPFLSHHNELYGTAFTYPDAEGRYYLNEFTGENFKVTMAKLRYYYANSSEAHLEPLPGAVSALETLRKRFDLAIVSSQQPFQTKYTRKALSRHFGDVFKEIHFTGSNPLKRKQSPKSVVCKQLGADYLIDDHISNALVCAEAGITVILFGDYPWNRAEELPANIIRCKNWEEVLEYFDARG